MKDNLDGYLNFYSVSGDGRVTNWTIVKTALWNTDVLSITFTKQLENFTKEETFRLLKGTYNICRTQETQNKLNDRYYDLFLTYLLCISDGGRCVAFNPGDETMFLVGTDLGIIYKCTTEYSSKFLQTYDAHNTPIYNIAWNPYVPSVFLTCSAEWMIKIWDHKGE